MKRLIRYLYNKYCLPDPHRLGNPIDLKKLTPSEYKVISKRCEAYMGEGILERLASIQVNEWEADGFYNASPRPIQTTETELYRAKCNALGDFFDKLRMIGKTEDQEDYNKFDPT